MYYGFEKDYKSLAVNEYINGYTNMRIQAKIKWMPPVKYKKTSIYIA